MSWLSVRQVLAELPIGKSLLYRLIAEGELRSTRLGGRILIDSESLTALLDANARGGQPQTGPAATEPPPQQQPGARPSPRRRRTSTPGKRFELW